MNETWQVHHIVTKNGKETGVGKLLRAQRGLQVPMFSTPHKELHAGLNDFYKDTELYTDLAYGQQAIGGATIRRAMATTIEDLTINPIENIDTLAEAITRLVVEDESIRPNIREEAELVIGGLLLQQSIILDGVYSLS